MADEQQRARRTTAGKRMNFLTGQALEDDEAFWGHDTWESDNESFHSSDQDEAPDQFDSDFNETEESSDEEEAAGAEKEIADDERKNRKRKGGYSDNGAKFGKPSGGAKKIKPGKRIVGDEHNAGIVLNFPGGPAAGTVPAGGIARPKKAPTIFPTATTVPALAATRQRRSAREASGYSNEAREAASAAAEEAQRKQPTVTAKATKTKNQVTFQQADILLEAVNDTEPSNERWLLGRKRIQAEKELSTRDKGSLSNSTYAEKFVSRKGYLNTINFADMDRIPSILLQKRQAAEPKEAPLCAATGKPARYRDPKSGYGYYDSDAFRIVRAKWEEEQATKKEEAEKGNRSRKAAKTNGKNAGASNEKQASTPVENGETLPPALNEKTSADTQPSVPSAAAPKRRPGRPRKKTPKEPLPAISGTDAQPLTVGTDSTEIKPDPPLQSPSAVGSSEASPSATLQPQLPSSPDHSSRKSPRRWKPTTRMLESIDEGLLPAMPESSSTSDRPAALARRKDD